MTTTASILGLERPLLTTAMGILPHRDPHAALDLAFSLDIPFWPQLPNLSFSEDTYVQTVRGIPGVEVDHEGLRILFDEDGFYAGLEEYLSLDPLDDLFAVTVEESATFGGFLERASADYPALLDDIASRRLDLRAMIAPGEPLGLEDAGSALVAMGSTPSRGIVLIDPTR